SPEVVDDQEAALLQVRPQALDLVVAEADHTDVFHVEDRTVEEQRVGESDDDVVGLPGPIEPDVHRRQLAQAHGEIVVGAWKVGAPAGAALLESIAGEVGAAEVEGPVEVLRLRPLRRLAIEAPDAAAAHPDPRLPFRILLTDLREDGRNRKEHGG